MLAQVCGSSLQAFRKLGRYGLDIPTEDFRSRSIAEGYRDVLVEDIKLQVSLMKRTFCCCHSRALGRQNLLLAHLLPFG